MKNVTSNGESAAGLIEQIRAEISKHDAARRETRSTQGARRAHLAGHNDGDGAASDRLHSLNTKLDGHKETAESAEATLQKLLPEGRAAVIRMLGGKPDAAGLELLAFLDDAEESALVRCERAAEFLEQAVTKPA